MPGPSGEGAAGGRRPGAAGGPEGQLGEGAAAPIGKGKEGTRKRKRKGKGKRREVAFRFSKEAGSHLKSESRQFSGPPGRQSEHAALGIGTRRRDPARSEPSQTSLRRVWGKAVKFDVRIRIRIQVQMVFVLRAEIKFDVETKRPTHHLERLSAPARVIACAA